jgi:glycosyltransferase involved in cell wall biosynthesis
LSQKIVFFHLLNNFTGSPKVLRNVIEVAKNDGLDVELYTSSGKGFLSDIPGVSYHSNFYIRSRFRFITLFTFFLSQLLLLTKLWRYRRVDCVFYVNTILPFSAIWMGYLLGKKVIAHVHEFEISPRLLNNFLFWVVRSFADEIVVVSNFLATNKSLRGRTARIIYNCVNTEIENAAKSEFSKSDKFRVLMLASLRDYKGINEFKVLADRLPELEFDLILSDSDQEVVNWKLSFSAPPNLNIWPVQTDVIKWYSKASLVLNLSHPDKWLETFGMTILEGMYFGLPAIVPTKGGITELVEDGVNGYLVDYTELDRIRILLKEISSSSAKWLNLSNQAKLKSKRFNREKFSDQISSLLST